MLLTGCQRMNSSNCPADNQRMSYTQFRDGLRIETTPGTSTVTDPAHDCNLWGAMSEESKHPSPEVVLMYTAPGYNNTG